MKACIGVLALAACGMQPVAPDAMPDAGVPALRNPVALTDHELAQQALALLGAGTQSGCAACHGLTRANLGRWRTLTDAALATCLVEPAIGSADTARTMADCARTIPGLGTADFGASRLGIYSAATHLPWFQHLFARAYGDEGPAQHALLVQQAGMPRGEAQPFTQPELDIVAEWFARGLPRLEATLPDEPPPEACTPLLSSEVTTHVTELATTGWRALNRTNGLAMHGCGSATEPTQCLTDAPLAVDQPYGAGWEIAGHGRIRVLVDVTYTSQFWTRSSADGRFVAHGVDNVTGSYVHDLARGVQIAMAAEYDPAFFPDHSGFTYQGALANTCPMSVLTSNPASVSMTEPGCTRIITLGQYQHMARALGGGDYFAADSQFVQDDGGKAPTLVDPPASFAADATIDFTPMVFTGTTYSAKPRVRVTVPFEGDVVLSPSARFVLTRLAGPQDHQLGFVLRRLDATPAGSSYTIELPELARYCVTGGKPAFSYDERWLVFHHYEALGTLGAANLYLLDITTGEVDQITDMAPGQYALFPHFRSDGWIYAQVRDALTGHEYTIASDAALVLE